MPTSEARENLNAAPQEFAELVQVSNQILHSKPCAGPNGDARLSAERVLEIEDLEKAADTFSD